jgi:hypothetical protein
MTYTNEPTAQQLIGQVNILDLFSEVATLKKQGSEHVCSCPIHNEKTPSCYINEAKQTFHCKGCGAGGGVISFFMAYYEISKGDAFRMLKERLGIAERALQLEPAPIRLTEKGKAAKAVQDACQIESPYFFDEYGIVKPFQSVIEGDPVVVLSANGKPTDFMRYIELRRGKLTDEGVHQIGQYYKKICVCTDYIDSVYLSQKLGRDIMIVFCGHPARLNWAVDYIAQQYPDAKIAAAVPDIWDHVKYTETLDCKIILPDGEGYFCEKSQRQGFRK